jgi:F-type H+-transporting ATPase subunit b
MRSHTIRCSILALLLLAGSLLAPGAVFAAEGEGGWGIVLTLGRIFNLAIVIGSLVWVARKPLANFVSNRTQMIREQLAEAQAARKEAEAKLAEIESRMSGLDVELREIKEQAEKEAREEYERLVATAERDAERLIARARDEIEGMTRAAQLELKGHVAELSVRLAEEKIQREITDQDHARLFSGFVAKVGGES